MEEDLFDGYGADMVSPSRVAQRSVDAQPAGPTIPTLGKILSKQADSVSPSIGLNSRITNSPIAMPKSEQTEPIEDIASSSTINNVSTSTNSTVNNLFESRADNRLVDGITLTVNNIMSGLSKAGGLQPPPAELAGLASSIMPKKLGTIPEKPIMPVQNKPLNISEITKLITQKPFTESDQKAATLPSNNFAGIPEIERAAGPKPLSSIQNTPIDITGLASSIMPKGLGPIADQIPKSIDIAGITSSIMPKGLSQITDQIPKAISAEPISLSGITSSIMPKGLGPIADQIPKSIDIAGITSSIIPKKLGPIADQIPKAISADPISLAGITSSIMPKESPIANLINENPKLPTANTSTVLQNKPIDLVGITNPIDKSKKSTYSNPSSSNLSNTTSYSSITEGAMSASGFPNAKEPDSIETMINNLMSPSLITSAESTSSKDTSTSAFNTEASILNQKSVINNSAFADKDAADSIEPTSQTIDKSKVSVQATSPIKNKSIVNQIVNPPNPVAQGVDNLSKVITNTSNSMTSSLTNSISNMAKSDNSSKLEPSQSITNNTNSVINSEGQPQPGNDSQAAVVKPANVQTGSGLSDYYLSAIYDALVIQGIKIRNI